MNCDKKTWIKAVQLPDAKYNEIHEWILSVAGEGDPVTPEQLGLSPIAFMYPERILRITHKDGHYDIIYSISPDCDICFDLFSTYKK